MRFWILQVGREVGEPAGLLELPLLHVVAEVDDVEARAAGGQLDDGLLPLLLLRNDLGQHLDAGELGELRRVALQEVAARAFGRG